MLQINCPDLLFFETVQGLATDFGLTSTVMHEPTNPEVYDGLRVVRIHGLEERLELFSTVLPVCITTRRTELMIDQARLTRLWNQTPDLPPNNK